MYHGHDVIAISWQHCLRDDLEPILINMSLTHPSGQLNQRSSMRSVSQPSCRTTNFSNIMQVSKCNELLWSNLIGQYHTITTY